MKRFRPIVACLVLVALLLFAGTRLAMVASKAETGWESIAISWQDATLGWLGLGHTAVDLLEPSAQADFWLAEVERIRQDNPETAELCLGAAAVLDSPGTRFMQRYLKELDFGSNVDPSVPARIRMSLRIPMIDYEAVEAAKSQFEAKCKERCLSLAARATELDPGDVRWWRMRACLQFEGGDLKPRHSEWLEVLDECSRHDPDNALYDYLAAFQLWTEGANYEWSPDEEDGPEGEYRLVIKDAGLFQQGIDRFERGQRKRCFAIGEDAFPAIAHFLSLSRIPKIDQAEIATSRSVGRRWFHLYRYLWRWQGARAVHARLGGNPSQQIAVSRENHCLFDQAIAPAGRSALDTLILFGGLRRDSYETLMELAQEDPSIGQEELDALTAREKALRIESKLLARVLQEMDTARKQQQNRARFQVILAAVSLASSVLLLFVAGVVLLIGKLLKPRMAGPGRLGVFRHLAAWTIGCAGTFVIAGMAPAEMISRKIQTWVISAMLWAVALAIAALAIWQMYRVLRRRKFQFSLLSMFAVTTGVAIIASMWPVIRYVFSILEEHRPEVWLHAKGWSGIDAEVLRLAMGVSKGAWLWAVLQWLAHGGPYVGLAVSLVVVAAWFAWRCSRQSDDGFFNYWTRDIRTRWAILFSCVGKSALIAGACWLIVYLWAAPAAVRSMETHFQYKIRYCRNPKQHWDAIQAARSELSASVKEMEWIRKQVESEFSSEGQ